MLSLSSEPTIASVFAPRTRIDADGTVEGYASLFGEIDQARDMVMRGAFAGTLATRSIRRIPMLFQHDPSEPVGVWLELREDHRGLFARGRADPRGGARARAVVAVAGRGRGWPFDRLSHLESAHRSEDPYPPPARGGSLGNFHCHVPAAGGRARAGGEAGDLNGEAVTRPHARRTGVEEGRPRGP